MYGRRTSHQQAFNGLARGNRSSLRRRGSETGDRWAKAMKLSRTVTYAIQATLQLAESDSRTPVPCSKLASQGAMPERFLLQILRNLVNHGILQSTRGVDGGYALLRIARRDLGIGRD